MTKKKLIDKLTLSKISEPLKKLDHIHVNELLKQDINPARSNLLISEHCKRFRKYVFKD